MPHFWHVSALGANCNCRIDIGVFWLVDQMPCMSPQLWPMGLASHGINSYNFALKQPRRQFFGSEVTTYVKTIKLKQLNQLSMSWQNLKMNKNDHTNKLASRETQHLTCATQPYASTIARRVSSSPQVPESAMFFKYFLNSAW